MIEVRGLTYTYPGGTRPALRAIDLTVADGDFVVVAGGSGSGKSTLARVLAGIVPHFHGGAVGGTVRVAGFDTRTHGPRDLAGVVGFVDQVPEAQSVTDLVEDEIAFGMENLGVEPAIIRRRIEEVVDQVGIAHLRARRMATLSGGERQRVQIAAALALQPRLLILDEPTSQLDPGAAEDVFAILQRLHADLGLTLIVVEHRLERVVQHADRLVVLAEGEIVADGTPAEVLAGGAARTPLSRLAHGLGWDAVPLTVRDGRARAVRVTLDPLVRVEAPAGEPLLRARGVRVALGGAEVLRGIDLDGARGEVIAVAGRNGAGKTTLLRAVIGLTRARAGTVHLGDLDVARARLEDVAKVAAYVPQDAGAILFRRTVREEIAFTTAARGGNTDTALDAYALEGVADADPRDLSAGMRLRAAVAAATAGSPDVIALDEPTRGVDDAGKELLADLVRAWATAGALVLLVTHDVELIASCATRLVMLADGAVIVDGPARDVLGESALFSSQMHRVFGDPRIATVEDALAAVR